MGAVVVVFVASLGLLVRGTTAKNDALLPTGEAAVVSEAPSLSLGEAVRRREFWLLFVIVNTGMGGGLIVLNHVGQMSNALGQDPSKATILVSLVSIANCLGRVVYGVLPDTFAAMPRPLFCLANLLLMGTAQALLAYGSIVCLYLGAMGAGFCYGGFFTLFPSLVGELFGMQHFATIYNVLTLALSSASFLYSTVLASTLYDWQAAIHPAPSGVGCVGSTCYRYTCGIMVGACAVGAGCAIALHALARK